MMKPKMRSKNNNQKSPKSRFYHLIPRSEFRSDLQCTSGSVLIQVMVMGSVLLGVASLVFLASQSFLKANKVSRQSLDLKDVQKTFQDLLEPSDSCTQLMAGLAFNPTLLEASYAGTLPVTVTEFSLNLPRQPILPNKPLPFGESWTVTKVELKALEPVRTAANCSQKVRKTEIALVLKESIQNREERVKVSPYLLYNQSSTQEAVVWKCSAEVAGFLTCQGTQPPSCSAGSTAVNLNTPPCCWECQANQPLNPVISSPGDQGAGK